MQTAPIAHSSGRRTASARYGGAMLSDSAAAKGIPFSLRRRSVPSTLVTMSEGVSTRDAILEAATTHAADVIVVGIWNESPLRGLLLGSVGHKLLQLSDRPVLCVSQGAPERR